MRAVVALAILLSTGCFVNRAGTGAHRTDGGDAGRPDASEMDAGDMDAPDRDAGPDATGFDAGGDAAGDDAGTDAGSDAGVDAGLDAGIDGGTDAGVDSGPPIPGDWFDPLWGSRRRLTFGNAPHAENLDDFPVLVVLDSSNFDYGVAGASGEQIRFVDPDRTPLDYEIETWNPSGVSYIWVRVPRIDASSATDYVWLYYDQPTASDGQNADGVWAAPYRGVWHFDGSFDDSSGLANNGSASAAANVPGIIGGAKSFAMNQQSVVPDDGTLDITNAVTISAWMSPTNLSHQLAVLSKRNACGGQANYALFVRGDDLLQFEHFDAGWRTFARGTLVTGSWQWVAATFDTSTNEVRIFIDGAQIGAPFANSRSLLTDANAIEIGRNGGCGGDYMEGPMDEVRLEATARSPIWIAAQHRSMTDVYITYGSRERIR